MLKLLGQNFLFKGGFVFDFYHSASRIPGYDGFVEGVLSKKRGTSRIERVLLRKDTKSFSCCLGKELILEQFKYRIIQIPSILFIEPEMAFFSLSHVSVLSIPLFSLRSPFAPISHRFFASINPMKYFSSWLLVNRILISRVRFIATA